MIVAFIIGILIVLVGQVYAYWIQRQLDLAQTDNDLEQLSNDRYVCGLINLVGYGLMIIYLVSTLLF